MKTRRRRVCGGGVDADGGGSGGDMGGFGGAWIYMRECSANIRVGSRSIELSGATTASRDVLEAQGVALASMNDVSLPPRGPSGSDRGCRLLFHLFEPYGCFTSILTAINFNTFIFAET